MMKKIFAVVLTAISVLCMCMFVSACSSGDVSGKTYVLSSYEFESSSYTVEDMEKLYISALEVGQRFGPVLTFSEDGKVISDIVNTKYEKNGNKVKIDGYSLEISGDELRFSENVPGFSFGDLKITAVYQQQ